MNSTPVTAPFASVTTRTGPAWKMAVTPSSIASWTSFDGRHVLHVAAVDEGHFLGALADRCPRAVHRGEAATDDHDPLADVTGVGQAERRGAQVLEAVEHLGRVLARDAQLVRVVAADRHDDRIEALVGQVVEREVGAETGVADDLAAEPGDRLVFGLEDLDLGQAVLRDPVAEHPAGRRVALEDRHVVAGEQQVERGGHPGRPRADDRGLPPGRRLALVRDRRVLALVEHRLEDLVAGVAVAVADGDRLVDLVAPAVLLARRRADAAEDAGERDRPLEDAGALAPVGLGVGLEEARDVDVARALVLAGRQAVGVVVGEDQLEVRPAQAAQLLGLGLDLHLRLALRASTRSADAPRPRPRRRTSGTPRSRAASARSRGSGSRCRCRGRPRGSSGPRSPRRPARRPRSGCAARPAGAAATACR